MTKVLVVDDDAELRRVLKAYLENAGYEVETAGSAAAAMDVLDQSDIDVVVADVIMPGGSGIHLLRALRNRVPRIPVIVMTGSPSIETAASAVRGKAFAYLIKPVVGGTILQAVAAAAEEKAREDDFVRLREEERRHRDELERLVEERTNNGGNGRRASPPARSPAAPTSQTTRSTASCTTLS